MSFKLVGVILLATTVWIAIEWANLMFDRAPFLAVATFLGITSFGICMFILLSESCAEGE